ncbi:arginine deiminase [Crassaminicella indica]|uniref:Arginine deiminase n=1 Tax=Crassaminicella indica TaxID=2855394 RepID=A0ABX8RCM1_9CLOT|nr:arginine deiminase [Crassaminicella indica]QXM06795.1 arginine deiminase [Crassaminicella indica]
MGEKIPFLDVSSEIGKLKGVMLHRPGKELERITPEYLHALLFDDIPWLRRMQEEHDGFAEALRARGCTVYYYEKLLEDIMKNKEVKKQLVCEVVENCGVADPELEDMIKEFLIEKTEKEVTEIFIAGLHKKDFPNIKKKRLGDYIKEEYPFYINPLPNLYFTRDPGAVIGNGLSIHAMNTHARERETMILKYLYDFHPIFQKESTPLLYDYSYKNPIEGGDILVLSEGVIAIGCSERTSARAIEDLTMNLFEKNKNFKEVIAVQIPFKRSYMHLDTVLTMVDYDKFTIYPGVEDRLKAFRLTYGKIYPKVEVMKDLKTTFKKALGLSAVDFIQSGGGDEVTAAREQWNDSTNTLAIAPGVVITYNRNEASNETLRKHGIEVVEIEGSELVRGRGGPRCMSMPLMREKI